MAACEHPTDPTRTFCPVCGKLKQRDVLESIKLPGFVGVAHSTSPKIAEFWASGDPTVFDRP